MHDVLIVGLPMLMILAGILMDRAVVKELRAEMKSELGGMRPEANARYAEVLGRFNVLEAHMRQFYHLTGKLEARMDALEKR